MSEPTLSISLTVNDGNKALAFYSAALGAKETYRMQDPMGGVAHAEFMLNDVKVYLSEASEDWHAFAMPDGSMASCLFAVATDDCDAAFAMATEAGARPLRKPEDQFWGTRSSMVLDPFGYRWNFNQVIEEVSPEEVTRRAKELFQA